MIGSWSTDSPTGFSDDMIDALLRIQSNLAVATKMAVLNKLADNMLTTYLGGDAGKRVLNGQIKRGEGDTIRAALVMADMRGSTKLAETSGREVYIDTLNQFFDAIAAPFNRAGGQILSFLGDGFLAVYPCERHRGPSEMACQAALERRVQGHRQNVRAQQASAPAGRPARDRLRHRPSCRQCDVWQCRIDRPADIFGLRLRRQRSAETAGSDQEISAAADRQQGICILLRRRLGDARQGKAGRRSAEADRSFARHVGCRHRTRKTAGWKPATIGCPMRNR